MSISANGKKKFTKSIDSLRKLDPVSGIHNKFFGIFRYLAGI